MKTRTLLFIVVSVIVTTIGCRSFTSPARYHNLEKSTGYWLDYDASRRGAFLSVNDKGSVKMLAEPSPDVAIEVVQKYLAKINYEKISGEGSLDFAENITQLGKRTTTIMFLRDSLYRLAEMKNNGTLDNESIALFNKALDATLKLAEAELKQAEASKAKAEARKYQRLKELGLKDELLKDILKK